MPDCGDGDDHQPPKTPGSDSSQELGSTVPAAGVVANDRIDRYRFLERLGEGGMGIVYLAEQLKPVHRKVALKVIKVGMDTEEVVARFEAERQALALMDHPNIANVLDAGATAAGRPYFVMELVRGIPITAFCDQHRLDLRERLELFISVCDAVQHAHQKGVIHRDLKPSNILVETSDGHVVPKVIDFGVAKAITHRLTERTLVTQIGHVIGTPQYMSPEQAVHSSAGVDTRTDIYSLGVVLYELLTGVLPIAGETLAGHLLDEVQRLIREYEPPRPSTRVTGRTELTIRNASCRRTEPAALARQLRRDLDWITMKALEKSPLRRYAGAGEFADDIRRFLRNEPVLAGPPSTLYRVRKFVRRHRVGVSVVATLAMLLVAFSLTTALQARRIAWERDRANREAETSRQVSDFLVGLFESTDPTEGQGVDVSARQILHRGLRRIATDLREQPVVRATMLETMGKVHWNLGLFDQALELVQESLDIRQGVLPGESAEVAASLNLLGVVKHAKGDYGAAEAAMKRALAIQRAVLGNEHADVATSLSNLGSLSFSTGDWASAEMYYGEALALNRRILGVENPATATIMNNLAMVLSNQRRFEEADALYRESLAIRRRLWGNDHPQVASSLNGLAMSQLRQRNFSQAEPMLLEALAINRKHFGDVHPEVATLLNNLALVHLRQGQADKAEEYYRQVLPLNREIYGDNHPRTAGGFQNLGAALLRGQKYEEAERALRQAVAIKLMTFPENHWEVATTNNMLGGCLMKAGQYEAAEPLLVDSYNIIKTAFGLQHDRTRHAGARLIALYEATGRQQEAEQVKSELGTLAR